MPVGEIEETIGTIKTYGMADVKIIRGELNISLTDMSRETIKEYLILRFTSKDLSTMFPWTSFHRV